MSVPLDEAADATAQLGELTEQVEALYDRLRAALGDRALDSLDDEEAERVRGRLARFPHAELVVTLLALQDFAQVRAMGRAREILAMQRIVLGQTLDRVIPAEITERALAIYYGDEAPHFSPVICAGCGRPALHDERGWKAFLTSDDEAELICHECADA